MLKLIDLNKTYNQDENNQVNALNGINLEFGHNGLVFVIGKSGSGKSTLLNILAGLDKQTSGDVLINGTSTKSYTEKDFDIYRNSVLGFVFQEYNLLTDLTVEENLKLISEMNQFQDTNYKDLLNRVDLYDCETRYPNQLSSGQKQRVAIARSLIKNPKIILADEPTGALDSETAKQVLGILKELSKDRLVIVVTHDKESALTYGDRIIELRDGLVVGDSLNKPIELSNIDITYRESKIGFKSIFHLAKTNVFKHKIRFLITVCLSIIAFMSFGVIDGLSQFDYVNTAINSTKDSGLGYISLDETFLVEFGDESGIVRNGITNKELESLNEIYPDTVFYKLFRYEKSYDFNFYYEIKEEDYIYYYPHINGALTITNEILDDLGLEIVDGSLPTSNDQICISEYTYDMIQKYSIKDGTNKIEINQYSDIPSSVFDKTVSCVIDTKFNDEYFINVLDIEDPWSFEGRIKKYEVETALEYGLHNTIFTYTDMYQEIPNVINLSENMFFDIEKTVERDVEGAKISIISLATMDVLNEPVYFIEDEITSLSDNQVIIPLSIIENDIPIGNHGSYVELFEEYMNQITLEYANQVFDELKSTEEFFIFDFPYEYAEYLTYIETNEYEPGIDFEYFKTQTITHLLDTVYKPYFEDGMYFEQYSNYTLFSEKLEIVGVYEDSVPGYVPLIISDNQFDYFTNRTSSDVRLLITSIEQSKSDLDDLFMDSYLEDDQPDKKWYAINNEITSTLNFTHGMFEGASSILFYVAVFISIFSGVFLLNYILLTVNEKKKEIGILRSMGSSRNDIHKIFITQALLIALINAIGAIVLGFITNFTIDYVLSNKYNVLLKVTHFGFRQVFIILLISVVIALVSTIIPINRINKLNPIDAIRSE